MLAFMVKYGINIEDVNGQKDFDYAGSLCHGWGAMPIIYYNLLEQYNK
jgi:hypothetical protein